MRIRTNEIDIVAMSLLHLNKYTGACMIKYEKALEFNEIINNNLTMMNSKCNAAHWEEIENKLYFKCTDENDNIYAVINPMADLEEAFKWHVSCLPFDIIKASQMPNALEVIGLEIVDNRIVKKGGPLNSTQEQPKELKLIKKDSK